MNIRQFIIGCLLYLLGQTLVWFQINGQFINNWIQQKPLVMSLLGFPISLIFIYATKHTFTAFDSALWPVRFLSFSTGILVFSILTYLFLGQNINLKTGVSLMLAFIIIIIQIFWK